MIKCREEKYRLVLKLYTHTTNQTVDNFLKKEMILSLKRTNDEQQEVLNFIYTF